MMADRRPPKPRARRRSLAVVGAAALVALLVSLPLHITLHGSVGGAGVHVSPAGGLRPRAGRSDGRPSDARGPSLEDPDEDGEGEGGQQAVHVQAARGRATSPRHHSSDHAPGRRSKEGRPRHGGPSVGAQLSTGLSSLLGAGGGMMRITSSNDPKIGKRDAKDTEKRILKERQSLGRAIGKLPDGFIVELSLLRGDSPSVVVDSGAWPRVGSPASRSCTNRGIADGDNRRACLCPALLTGPACESPVPFERARTMAEWQGPYKGPLLCAGNTLSRGQAMKVAKNPAGASRGDFLPRELIRAGPTLMPLLPATDPMAGQLIRSCAVVGNGAILLHGPPRARDIDAHSAVFRINAGPTKGYERIVGKKTTFRVNSNEAHAFAWREDLSEVGIQLVRSNDDLKAFFALKRRLKGLRVTMMHTDFLNWMDNAFWFMPSSGLYALMISLLRCARVSVYGFQATGPLFRDMFSSRYHYYEVSDRATDSTRDEEEWEVLRALADAKVFSFGDPCIRECHGSKASLSDCGKCFQRAQLVKL